MMSILIRTTKVEYIKGARDKRRDEKMRSALELYGTTVLERENMGYFAPDNIRKR